MANHRRNPADEAEHDILCALTSDVNVLISGGDNHSRASLARKIYAHSARRDGRFITLNRAAPPWRLLDRDTLFVEELNGLTPAMRDELTQWLEGRGRSVARRAGHKPRIIAATADDRLDGLSGPPDVPAKLFYQLNIIHLALAQESPGWVM